MVAIGARSLRALSTSGAAVAALAGAAACASGWWWGVLLVAYFALTTALSKSGSQSKARLMESIVEKGDERDGWQVLANGGAFVGAALGHLIWHSPSWYAIGAGALAASAADTWATEVGMLSSGQAVSIVSGRRVPVGTSGGVTVAGSVAALGGALFIAVLAAFARWPIVFAAVALGGIAGAITDSLLGASVQCRRWCSACGKATERKVHNCNAPTEVVGGSRWVDNDVVNGICSVVGGLITLVLQ